MCDIIKSIKTINKNQSGFGLVEFLLFILILSVVGFGGYYVYHNQHKKSDTTKTSNVSANSSTKATTSTNIYSGWKNYCDNQSKTCFYYPSGWTAEASLGGQGTSMVNKPATVSIYENASPGDSTCTNSSLGTTSQFYVNSLNDVNSPIGLKIVGGYFRDNFNGAAVYNPFYLLVNSKLIAKYNVQVGSTINFPVVFSCTAYGVNNLGDADAQPIGTVNASTQSALSWLDSSEAKVGLQILQSAHTQ